MRHAVPRGLLGPLSTGQAVIANWQCALARPMADNPLAAAVRCSNFAGAVKLIDLALKVARGAGSANLGQLLCNRAYCYHQLGLLRKALKVQHSFSCADPGIFVCCLASFAWQLTTLWSVSGSLSGCQQCPQLVRPGSRTMMRRLAWSRLAARHLCERARSCWL